MKKIIVGAVIVFIVFAGILFFVGRTFFPDNLAETAPDGGAKGLKTRFYTKDLSTVRRAVRDLIPKLSTYGSNWKISGETENADVYSVKAEVPVVFFVDDLEVKIQKADNLHETRVDVVSKSRVGKSDFGENARHVRKFLNALDEKLSAN